MASTSSTNIEELLSRAKMISVKLGLHDISEWLQYELNDYPAAKDVPDYRILKHVPIKAFNPYRGWIVCELGDLNNTHQEVYEKLTTVNVINSVSTLVELAKSEKNLKSVLPAHYASFLNELIGNNFNFRLEWDISPILMTAILSNTRSKILDWALQLEKNNILGEGLLFSKVEKREAAGMTINTINFHGNVNNAGAIGAGNTGDISQQNIITAGDFSSLERQLKEYGIQDTDIAELKQAIQDSPAPTSSDNLGQKVGGWIGNMIGKAYSGGLKIAASAAPVLLTNALCNYYSIPV